MSWLNTPLANKVQFVCDDCSFNWWYYIKTIPFKKGAKKKGITTAPDVMKYNLNAYSKILRIILNKVYSY